MKWKVLFFFIEFLSFFLICTIFLERWNVCMFTWNNTTLSYAPDDFLAFCDLKPCLWPFFFFYIFFLCATGIVFINFRWNLSLIWSLCITEASLLSGMNLKPCSWHCQLSQMLNFCIISILPVWHCINCVTSLKLHCSTSVLSHSGGGSTKDFLTPG